MLRLTVGKRDAAYLWAIAIAAENPARKRCNLCLDLMPLHSPAARFSSAFYQYLANQNEKIPFLCMVFMKM